MTVTEPAASPLNDQDVFGYFRLGLATGLVDRGAVIAWADREVLRRPVPQNEIIELCLSGHLPYSQLIWLLTSYHPSLDYDLPVRLVLARAALLLDEHHPPEELLTSIGLLAAEARLPEEIRALLRELDSNLGYLSTPELLGRLGGLLAPYREYQPLLREIG